MRICRIHIKNFRNFEDLDIEIGQDAVFIGENKIGKSNLLYALRLVLDPSLPDSARNLRQEDFWDGLERPLKKTDKIFVSVWICDFEDNEFQTALLAEHLVSPEPMVAKLTYAWQPLPGKTPVKDADYEFQIYGGPGPESRVGYDVRRRLPMELIPALRDCEGDLARWTRSPLRPLLDKAAADIERDELEKLANSIDKSTGKLTDIHQVKSVADSITDKLEHMVGKAQSLETALRFSPTEPDKLIRALRIFIDGGRRSISDASLGSANLLYFALKSLEYDQLIADGERDHTILAIEEPEAHLHPNLQRLIFRNYLRPRGTKSEKNGRSATILMTTHSPHVASVTPLRDFVVLRLADGGRSTVGRSTAALEFAEKEIDDLERYIDVTRGEAFFARGVVLVEGDAERLLIPVLAEKQGYDLDELGICISNIMGTNFAPYLKLLGPEGLKYPVAALTDFDPREPNADGSPRDPLGPERVVNQMMRMLLDEKTWAAIGDRGKILALAPKHGVFMNRHTFEIELFRCGLQEQFAAAMDSLSASLPMKARMKRWAKDPDSLEPATFLGDIEAIGKGRFGQRLASWVAKSSTKACPSYISNGLKYVVDKTRRT